MGKSNETRDALVAEVLAMLDAGIAPWCKPWEGRNGGRPVNAVTHKTYRGMNRLILMWRGAEHWAGKGQWGKIGATVKTGETSTRIWAPKRFIWITDKATGDRFRLCVAWKPVHVYSAGQVTGWTAPKIEETSNDIAPIDAADAIVNAMPNRPTVDHVSGDSAHYSPALDRITMPEREQFKTAEGYYSTLFHEFSHATGHASRCNRDGMGNMVRHEYSREELVAEFSALFLCGECGIAPAVKDNSVAYLKTWRDRIANAPDIMDGVINDAQRAADYVTGKGNAKGKGATDAA